MVAFSSVNLLGEMGIDGVWEEYLGIGEKKQ